MKSQKVKPVHLFASQILDYIIGATNYGIHRIEDSHLVIEEGTLEHYNNCGLFSGYSFDKTELCVSIYDHNPNLTKEILALCMKHDGIEGQPETTWIEQFYDENFGFSFWMLDNDKSIEELEDESIRKARTIQCMLFYVFFILKDCIMNTDFEFTESFKKNGWTFVDGKSTYYKMQRYVLTPDYVADYVIEKTQQWLSNSYGSAGAFSSVTSTAKAAYSEAVANTHGFSRYEVTSVKLDLSEYTLEDFV
ncbi:hypothetical protein HJ167_21570 [Vibrio parahaemolyticus]|nr:hypothetical protein [Vibrio parahaemolyticus]